jgi:hypothetical protein
MPRYLLVFTGLIIGLIAFSANAGGGAPTIIFDMPDSLVREHFGQSAIPALSSEELQTLASYRFNADTFRVIVIPVD